MKESVPIYTTNLFPKLDQKLIELLKSFSLEDWQKQSIAPLWKVHDIAVHLLDGNIRTLSMARDGYFGVQPGIINSYQDLVDYLNKLNADWVIAMKRVSPKVLIEMLEITGKEYCDYLTTLNPFDKAIFSVGWAGEDESYNWFHVAREYTEKWHHQQQIRLAVGQDKELYEREFYFPHLDTSMRALPHHYRTIKGEKDEVIKVSVSGEGGGNWFLYFDGDIWGLLSSCEAKQPSCEIVIEGEVAWRMFTKGISRQEAEKHVTISGKLELGVKIFNMLAVMA